MKTVKIILCVAGFALTSFCFGQLLTNSDNDVLFYSAYFDAASNRFEHRLNEYPVRTSSGDHFEAPLLSRTYFVPLENDMAIESWMTAPFENSFYEEKLLIEEWMTTPFETIEEIEGDILIEEWMTTSWV